MKKEVAGFPRRVIAYLIDIIIINFLILSPFKLTKVSVTSLAFSRETIILSITSIIITLLYFTLLEFTVRQTLGKIITKIYVSSTLKTWDLKQCIIRNISKPVQFVLVIDVLYALYKKTHQRYFEAMSNTEVLKIPE
jgi:uncharacterized RDD family membrane protein YckC